MFPKILVLSDYPDVDLSDSEASYKTQRCQMTLRSRMVVEKNCRSYGITKQATAIPSWRHQFP